MIESKLRIADASYTETVLAGEHWMREIREGQAFRIIDVEGKSGAPADEEMLQTRRGDQLIVDRYRFVQHVMENSKLSIKYQKESYARFIKHGTQIGFVTT